jgi:DNA uptake protein ComE-like DNA-binding protein
VTVLDHAALINLNVHGYSDQVTATKWPFTTAACTGKGYFMCDVQPSLGSSQNLFNLIEGTTPPGRWGTGSPVKATGEIVIENPMLNQHAPFTLDEEFELRRLVGTFYTSRLEKIWQTGLEANPNDTNMATAAAVQNRLKFTTVGWTAEIRGDPINTDQDSAKDPTHKTAATGGGTWSATKLDLNDVKNISELDIRTALYEGRVFAKGTGTAPFFSPTMAQFSMNIKGFREQLTTWPNITVNGVTYLAARRQPVLLRVKAYWISNDAGKKEDKWGVRAQVYNPWPQGDYPGKTGATLSTPSMRVRFYKADATTMDGAAFPTSMAANAFYESTEKAFTTPAQSEQKDVNKVLGAYFARLEYTAISGKTITLDWCDTAKVSGVTCFVRRGLTVEEEVRGDGSKQEAKVQVLYVTDWVVQSPEDWTTTKPAANAANKDHPIRFPASVPSSYDGAVSGPLPISDSSTTPKFRAFPRLGDLNQVLCPESDPAANPDVYWPWLDRVAKAPANEEEKHKFNWKDTTATPPESGVSRVNAANVFTVSSMPWLDNIDNDGDGAKDISGTTPDTGKELITSTTKPPENTGRFAGPEIRIAGKINLNTASDATLEALDAGASGIKAAVISARASGPIKSIAQVVEKLTSPGTGDDAKGWIEKRDLAFTRISNIASVRSDTFSIYGTVQYIIPPRGGTTSMRVIKSRRFWALVDRSPSAAYPPTSVDFIHPRVLNFQWLD